MKHSVRALLVMCRERRLSFLEQLDACRAEVLPACDWEEAERILSKVPVDVIVTDTKAEWRRVLDAAGKRAGGPQVVICARRVDERLCAELFRQGAYDVLVEPYTGEELLRVLEAAAAKTYMNSLRLPGTMARAAGA
jgi:DNA-binding NtrC family response regulator